MIRILHVVTKMDAGGIETLIMNFYRNIDRSKIQFDFLLHRKDKGFYDDEIRQLGGRFFYVPSINPLHHNKYISSLNYFFSMHKEYKIVHSHINAFSMYVLRAAANAGVPIRIAHSHIANPLFDLKTPFRIYCKLKIKKYATHLFACSEMAGKWLFGNNILDKSNFYIIKNAIYSDKYVFDYVKRDFMRNQLGINDKTVFIHVGRFTKQKNHHFLIEFIKKYTQVNQNVCLLLLGEGNLLNETRKLVLKSNLNEFVKFVGVKNNVSDYLMAADCFLFPSIFEGLGIVAIEAQTAGLLTVVSNYVPKEAKISTLYHSEELNIDKWIEVVHNKINYVRTIDNVAKMNGYDIVEVVNWLQNFYERNYEL